MEQPQSRRGRPPGLITQRRRQALDTIAQAAMRGERISYSRLARECGLYDYRDARRIIGDLRRMGKI